MSQGPVLSPRVFVGRALSPPTLGPQPEQRGAPCLAPHVSLRGASFQCPGLSSSTRVGDCPREDWVSLTLPGAALGGQRTPSVQGGIRCPVAWVTVALSSEDCPVLGPPEATFLRLRLLLEDRNEALGQMPPVHLWPPHWRSTTCPAWVTATADWPRQARQVVSQGSGIGPKHVAPSRATTTTLYDRHLACREAGRAMRGSCQHSSSCFQGQPVH